MSYYKKTYVMFVFGWTDAYQAYDYAFDCRTGKIAEDHGEIDGAEEDLRYVVDIEALTRTSVVEWDQQGDDMFGDDLEEIGRILARQAGFDTKQLLRPRPKEGQAVFVWDHRGGLDPATDMGPEEGWSEMEFLGTLDSLTITK